MDEHEKGYAQREVSEVRRDQGALELRETLGKVDRVLETFYEIHGSVISDKSQNP